MSPTQPLLQHFSHLKDPRVKRTQLHPLENILTIAICAVICGAENWIEIEDYAYAKEAFFSQIIDLSNGIPSHDTFGRVFAALDPCAFTEGFTAWVQTLVSDWDDDIIAIDGKTMRRSLDKANGKVAVHLVSAFSAHNRLVLGQVKVDDKSNEITAIPELLKRLALSGCLVTLDAMRCQKKITSNIRDAGADYVLSLKGNQRELLDDTRRYFEWCENHPEKNICMMRPMQAMGGLSVAWLKLLMSNGLSAERYGLACKVWYGYKVNYIWGNKSVTRLVIFSAHYRPVRLSV